MRWPFNFLPEKGGGGNLKPTSEIPRPIDHGPEPFLPPYLFWHALGAQGGARPTNASVGYTYVLIPNTGFALMVNTGLYNLNRGLMAQLRPAPTNRGNIVRGAVAPADNGRT